MTRNDDYRFTLILGEAARIELGGPEGGFVFPLGCHGFGVFDKAVRLSAADSISHDHVEDSMIVAPCVCYLEKRNCPHRTVRGDTINLLRLDLRRTSQPIPDREFRSLFVTATRFD